MSVFPAPTASEGPESLVLCQHLSTAYLQLNNVAFCMIVCFPRAQGNKIFTGLAIVHVGDAGDAGSQFQTQRGPECPCSLCQHHG